MDNYYYTRTEQTNEGHMLTRLGRLRCPERIFPRGVSYPIFICLGCLRQIYAFVAGMVPRAAWHPNI